MKSMVLDKTSISVESCSCVSIVASVPANTVLFSEVIHVFITYLFVKTKTLQKEGIVCYILDETNESRMAYLGRINTLYDLFECSARRRVLI